MSEIKINWRTIGVKRAREYEPLVVRLYQGDGGIFNHIKDIMVFAAMVGFSNSARKKMSSTNTISITLDTYSTDNKDSFIFLLAMMTFEDAACLKDGRLHESVVIFEEYCNGGLEIIQNWMDEEPALECVDVILRHTLDRLKKTRGTSLNDDQKELPQPIL